MDWFRLFIQSRQGIVAVASLVAIAASLILTWAGASETARIVPLVIIVVVGGVPLVWDITKDLIARSPGADLLAAIAIVTARGPGLFNAVIAVSVVTIPVYARVTRSRVLSVREQDFVAADRALGVWAPL